MALVLNQEQEMLRESAMAFLNENAPVAHLRKLRDTRDETGFSRDLWRGFADMGFTGMLIPEAHGGLGLGQAEAGIVMEAIGHTLAPTPFLSTSLLAASLLVRHGSKEQKENYLPKIAAGNLVAALAVDEMPKHRPSHQALRAVRDERGLRLDGDKTFVVDGHAADLLIVSARTSGNPDDADGITLLLVDPKAKGVTIERTIMVDSHNAARINFRDVAVDASAVIGEVGKGRLALDEVLDIGRAALASELLGIADQTFARTLSYLKERKQFGQTIGEFQALQHRAADLYTEIEITRSVVLRSRQALDAGEDGVTAIVSAAKARAGATATLAVQEGVQMHGGIGMTDELEIGFFMKRARVAQELFGDTNFHADRWARLNAY